MISAKQYRKHATATTQTVRRNLACVGITALRLLLSPGESLAVLKMFCSTRTTKEVREGKNEHKNKFD